MRYAGPILLVLALAGAGLIRVHRLAAEDYWLDEIHSLVNSAAQRAAFEALPHGEILPAIASFDAILPPVGVNDVWQGMREDTHPPVYFVFLHLWRRLAGDGEFVTRLPSVMFSLIAMTFTAWTVRRLGGWTRGIAAAIALGLGYASLRTAQDARPYALASLFISLSYWSFSGLFLDHGKKRRGGLAALWVTYVLSSTLALLTHYFSAAVLVGQVPFVVVCVRGRPLVHWMGSVVVALILFGMAWLPQLLTQLPVIESYDWINTENPNHVWHTLMRLGDAPVRLLIDHAPFQLSAARTALGLSLLGACTLLVWRRRRRPAILLIAWCLTPLLVLAAVDLATGKETLKHLRYICLAAPGLAALLGWCWAGIQRTPRRIAAAVFAMVVLLTLPRPTPTNPHNRIAAAYIAEAMAPRTLVVFEAIGWPPFWAAQMYHNVAFYLRRIEPPLNAPVLLLRDPPGENVLAELHKYDRLVVISPHVDAVLNPLSNDFVIERRSPYVTQIGFIYVLRREAASPSESGSRQSSSNAISPTTHRH